jgi:hypothetical protein
MPFQVSIAPEIAIDSKKNPAVRAGFVIYRWAREKIGIKSSLEVGVLILQELLDLVSCQRT